MSGKETATPIGNGIASSSASGGSTLVMNTKNGIGTAANIGEMKVMRDGGITTELAVISVPY